MEIFIILFLVGIIIGGILVLSIVSQRFGNINYIPRTSYVEGEGRGVGTTLILFLLIGIAVVVIYNFYNDTGLSDFNDILDYNPNNEMIMRAELDSEMPESETPAQTIQSQENPEQVFRHIEITDLANEGSFGFQVGSFSSQSNALQFLNNLIHRANYGDFIIIEEDRNGVAWYKVVAIGFNSKELANDFGKKRMIPLGIKGFVTNIYEE